MLLRLTLSIFIALINKYNFISTNYIPFLGSMATQKLILQKENKIFIYTCSYFVYTVIWLHGTLSKCFEILDAYFNIKDIHCLTEIAGHLFYLLLLKIILCWKFRVLFLHGSCILHYDIKSTPKIRGWPFNFLGMGFISNFWTRNFVYAKQKSDFF